MIFDIKNTGVSKMLPFVLMLTAFAITGCGSDSTTSVETKTDTARTVPVRTSTVNTGTSTVNTGTVTVTEADEGSTMNLAVGATLQVVLKSNPSTGYHWVASVDQSCLQQTGTAVYTPDPDSEGRLGAGGSDTFSFNAVSPCQASLLMDYLSPANLPSDTTFSITVNITE